MSPRWISAPPSFLSAPLPQPAFAAAPPVSPCDNFSSSVAARRINTRTHCRRLGVSGGGRRSNSLSPRVRMMAEKQLPFSQERPTHEKSQSKFTIPNKHGEKLVGVLDDTGSKKLVILCHGFRSSKDEKMFLNLTAAFTSAGISVFRFDFAGNGESEGAFQYGHYRREVEDLHAIILYFLDHNYEISAIIGHSKGGNAVLLYASVYHDVHIVINISGRFALDRGIEGRLGRDFMQRIKKDGFIDVKNRTGEVEYRVTEESLKDRLDTDMRAACLAIDKECRVLSVHGSKDEIVPPEDAAEFAKLIPNHKLHIMEGANHNYTSHQEELASLVLDFLKFNQVEDAGAVRNI